MEGGGRSSILKGMQRSPAFSWILVSICFSSISAIQSVQGPSQEGFISIDCGYSDGPSYEEPETKLTFFSDAPYVAAGESKRVSREGISRQYRTVRRFPKGDRNCYKLWPVQSGKKYMIRAEFWYYHYSDGDDYIMFDLHLGVNYWESVILGLYESFMTDVIVMASGSFIWVCLINTGKGTPFISTLELRPLADFMYPIANMSQSLVYERRRNYGGESVRYPDDQYDRIWFKGFVSGNVSKLNSSSEVSAKAEDQFQVPPAVMNTAFLGVVDELSIDGRHVDAVYIALHFAELQMMNSTDDKRRMNIELGGYLVSQNYSPPFEEVDHKDFVIPTNQRFLSVNINKSSSSSRLPLVNAMEAYHLRRMKLPLTDEGDAYAIHEIKRQFNVTRNWQGDPCFPKNYAWEGVGCKYDEGLPPRIIYLNMSSCQLSGEIPPSIVNLTALVLLDFSNNDFTGIVPHLLAELPSLKLVDLTGNSHLMRIPHKQCKSASRVKGNVKCDQDGIKMKIVIASASLLFCILVLIAIFAIWRAKGRKLTQRSDSTFKPQVVPVEKNTQDHSNIQSRFYNFTHLEIEIMTRNFSDKIGEGRFGTVYLGYMNDDTKVAIKILSPSPFHKAKEFQIQALLVARLHHQNLVSMIGYCDDDEENLALVYEYMEGGSICDILSGESDNSTLSWEKRLKIALDTAQGLDYLHNGCSPSIFHRDLKSPKILLSKDFEAKISDFGQSSAMNIDSFFHLSNSIYESAASQDPEYHKKSNLTKKSDVYCFGIVLLELISGRKPFISSSKSTDIVEWVHQCLERGHIMDIVDPRLKDNYSPTSLIKALEISKLCTLASSSNRLEMGNVVMMIKQCLQL